MTQEEIIDGNKLIAEFMGGKKELSHHIPDVGYVEGVKIDTPISKGYWHGYDQLEYSSSWDWLMPVAQKIIPPKGWIGNGIGLSILVSNGLGLADIELAYKRILNFIEWYNEQEKKT